jgi:hypothetical protein
LKHLWLVITAIVIVIIAVAGGLLALYYYKPPSGGTTISPVTVTKTVTFTRTTTLVKTSATANATPVTVTFTRTVTSTTTVMLVLNLTSLKPQKRIIRTTINDSIIRCMDYRVYSSRDFNLIESKEQRYKDLLTSEVSRTFGSGAKISGVSFRLFTSNNTVLVTFNVLNKVWITSNQRYADFLWLLTPLNLDFIENGFKETNHGLYWNGVINGVETYIEVLLPKQSVPYKAWGEPIGHCHGHVWWPKS